MNLRNEQVPLMCMVDGAKVEDLFGKESVTASYNAAVQSEEFKEALQETLKSLDEAVEELQKKFDERDLFKEIISEEHVMENVRANVIINAISQTAESIIFDGKDTEEVVAEIITPSFAAEILEGVQHAVMEECAKHALRLTMSNALLKGFKDLFN